ncbi:MAG: metal-binding protein [Thermoplasmataceae archaeon]
MSYSERVRCFDSITIRPEKSTENGSKGSIDVKGHSAFSFQEIFSYSEKIKTDANLAGLAMAASAINFSFFSRELVLDFPVTPEDLKFIKEMVRINNIEVFINKICRRRYEFFKRHVIPSNDEINLANAIGETSITANNIIENDSTIKAGRGGSMILSSGGKESLLSMGIMKKIGEDVHPFFFNESGSHWLPAKTSYEYFRNSGYNPLKVWSNTDRFYKKTLRNMDILDKRQIERKTDTYPVQLFIFPVYLLSSLPLVIKLGVSNIIMGNEFDDPLAMELFNGINHFYGVYDQTWDFATAFNEFLHNKNINSSLWSIVYPVFGSMIEKILIKEFPELFSLQRSCHSCRSVKGSIIPCGKCTKCLGVRMFIENAGGDPSKIYYENGGSQLMKEVEKARMRLDPDELHYLKQYLVHSNRVSDHVEGIHRMPGESMEFSRTPEGLRNTFKEFFGKWTNGTWELVEGKWRLIG